MPKGALSKEVPIDASLEIEENAKKSCEKLETLILGTLKHDTQLASQTHFIFTDLLSNR